MAKQTGFWLGATAAFCLSVAAPVQAEEIVYGPDDFAPGTALLSDFQQSFGQVVGSAFEADRQSELQALTVWGLYYNYEDFEESAPQQDTFTLRFHDIVDGDPEESFFAEFDLGAGDRTDLGENLTSAAGDELDLALYRYDFDLADLDIVLDAGDYLISVINDVGSLDQAQDGGYWHWLNGTAAATGNGYFRRENAADFNPNDESFQSTINWTGFGDDQAFGLTAIPLPAPLAMLAAGFGLLALRRRVR